MIYSLREKYLVNEGENLAKIHNLIFHEISAKNDNMDKLFNKIAVVLNEKVINKEIIPNFINNNIKVTSSKKYYPPCCNIN